MNSSLTGMDNPVSRYVPTSFLRISFDESVSNAARKMQMKGSTEAVVVRDGVPVGILTERDILYEVVAAGLDPRSTKVVDVMSSPLETIDETSKVREAIAKMKELEIRRLGITRNGKLIGIVTQKSILSGSIDEHLPLPELAMPGVLSCPYCAEVVGDKKELSSHIDKVHLGLD
jgi:signal-transduction protein with cAMP-binding, CBS, and nucleotidyltransferase domain